MTLKFLQNIFNYTVNYIKTFQLKPNPRKHYKIINRLAQTQNLQNAFQQSDRFFHQFYYATKL